MKYAIAVSSGTAALHCALLCLGIKPGDEIIVPNLTVIMTIMPIIYVGAIPVFVDCEKDSTDFDYIDLVEKISEKTKAIIPVYMWGIPYNLDKIINIAQQYNLKIIEDACQAQGSMWNGKYLGTFGDMGCFSLKDGKIISSGEGGYILTNSQLYMKSLKDIRNHEIKSNPKFSFEKVGYNYRLTNIQAYIALQRLKEFESFLCNRRKICEYYYKNIDFFAKLITEENGIVNNYSPIFLLSHENDSLLQAFSNEGILNSVGTFGLVPASKRKAIRDYLLKVSPEIIIKSTNCEQLLKKILAICITNDFNQKGLDENIKKIKDIRERFNL